MPCDIAEVAGLTVSVVVGHDWPRAYRAYDPAIARTIRRVFVNALFLDPGRSGGPETYLRELVPELARQFPDVRFTVVTGDAGAAALRRDGWEGFVDVEVGAEGGGRLRRAYGEQLMLPRLASAGAADLIHSLASTAPARGRVPSIITLHDVTFFRHVTFSAVTTFGLRRTVAAGARHAAGLIAVSQTARDEICEVLGLSPDRFAVVPHGPGRTSNVTPTPADVLRKRHRLKGGRVVLSVGAKRPHKNQGVLVRALRLLPTDVVLVLAGHPEAYDRELRALAHELGVESRVRFVDYVPDEDLEALWRLAATSASATLAEGFGLPVLEAMNHGVPVACSDLEVLREVGGDVPHYFDPGEPTSAAAAVEAALADDEAGARGKARAALFTWEHAAEGTFAAYERALSARS